MDDVRFAYSGYGVICDHQKENPLFEV